MIGFPFDSQVTYDEYGVPSFDRAISSQPLRSLINKLFSDGVMPNPSTNMQVVANSGMTIKIKPGFAIVKGCLKLEDTERTIEFEAASSSDRIDTVVLRLNDETSVRQLDFAVHKGTPATSPVRPELTRSGSIYEIGLADVFIPRNTSIITTSRITDTRMETARCGIVSSVSQFDTTTLYNQVQADLTDFKTDEQAAWLEWFNNLQYVLDGDVAGHLQNEIDTTNNKIGTTAIPASLGNTITGAIDSLNSTMTYKEIPITIDSSYSSNYIAYAENGIVYIKVTIKAGTSGNPTLGNITDSKYRPRNGVFGILGVTASGSDKGKAISCGVDSNGSIWIWLDSALGYAEDVQFTYPLKRS